MKLNTCITALCLLASTSSAQNFGAPDDALSHRVIAGWVQEDGTQIAAIELDLAEGWKTYWRAPGDAGIPPNFNWERARNVQSVRVQWPTPVVFWEGDMRSVGYKTRVVVPVVVTPSTQGEDVRLRGEMNLGLCADICVPVRIKLDETLPAFGANSRDLSLIHI